MLSYISCLARQRFDLFNVSSDPTSRFRAGLLHHVSFSNWAVRLGHRPHHLFWTTWARCNRGHIVLYAVSIPTTVAPGVLREILKDSQKSYFRANIGRKLQIIDPQRSYSMLTETSCFPRSFHNTARTKMFLDSREEFPEGRNFRASMDLPVKAPSWHLDTCILHHQYSDLYD
jgi:hypothetical protein